MFKYIYICSDLQFVVSSLGVLYVDFVCLLSPAPLKKYAKINLYLKGHYYHYFNAPDRLF